MGELNLDAAREARLEAQGERAFTFGEERYELPAEIPYSIVELLMTGAAAGGGTDLTEAQAIAIGINALPALLGEGQMERFRAANPSATDVNELVGWILREYGLVKDAPQANGSGGGGGEIDPKSPPSSE